MKKRIILLLHCALVLSLGACTSLLQVNTTRPADVPVSFDQWKVVVINRYNPDLLDYKREKKIEVFAHAAQEAYTGVLDAILQDSTFQLVHADSLNYRTLSANESLSPEQLKEIYAQHPHHLLLSLDHFDIAMAQETVREEDSDGSVSKTAHFTLMTKTNWTLFDSTGRVLDKTTLVRDELYQSRAVISGLLAIGPDMAKAGPAANRLAWNNGYDYWKRLHPQPSSYTRTYYTTKSLKAAAEYMAVMDWENAISLLKPIAEGKQGKDATRAAYNLAVVYEAMGNMKEAKYWAEQANKNLNPYANMLLHEWASRKL